MAGPPPGGCRHCGMPRREHARRWSPGPGWHAWTEPTQNQIKARMHARRQDRTEGTTK